MTEEQIKAKIAELEKELERYVNEVNLNIAFIRGKIQVLQDFIKPPAPVLEPEKISQTVKEK